MPSQLLLVFQCAAQARGVWWRSKAVWCACQHLRHISVSVMRQLTAPSHGWRCSFKRPQSKTNSLVLKQLKVVKEYRYLQFVGFLFCLTLWCQRKKSAFWPNVSQRLEKVINTALMTEDTEVISSGDVEIFNNLLPCETFILGGNLERKKKKSDHRAPDWLSTPVAWWTKWIYFISNQTKKLRKWFL